MAFYSFPGLLRTIKLPAAEFTLARVAMWKPRRPTAFRMAATSLWRSKSYLEAKFKRLRTQLGRPQSHRRDGP